MKKSIVLFGAIAFAAIAAQATNVKWGINNGALDTGLFANGSVLYLLQGTFAYDGDLAKQETFSIDKVTGGTVVNNGSQVSGTIENGIYWDQTGVSITPANSGLTAGFKNFFMVAISADGKALAYSGTSRVNIQNSALTASAVAGASTFTVAEAVPEPTTVALLALGLAAVGLKRKVA